MSAPEEITIDLKSDMPIEQVFQKHVVDGKSYFFNEVDKRVNFEYSLRHDIASALNVSINDVIIVGSAKMGFSLKTEKFIRFDEKYKNTSVKRNLSDIDIAVVNRRFFDRQSEYLYEISRHFSTSWIEDNWVNNFYYPDEKARKMKGVDSLFGNYVKYLARGWLRTDFLPSIYITELPWLPASEKWREILGRKVSIGIYSDWYYLKHYQMDRLQSLRDKFVNLEIDHV